MQQYFVDTPLAVGREYIFTKEQAHHAGHVLHLENEIVRLVYREDGFFARAHTLNGVYSALVEAHDEMVNEPRIDMTIALALIRREKFELALMKAAELGAARIVPFESSRCVVHAKEERGRSRQERWDAIVKEAAEQCKRNRIPEVTPVAQLQDLSAYRCDWNAAAYEKAGRQALKLTDLPESAHSVLVVIGPEGGFSPEEADMLAGSGFAPVTLGSRILRAETAVFYSLSALNAWTERTR